MTPNLLMLLGTIVCLVSVVILTVNFYRITNNPALLLEGKGVSVHLLSVFGANAGGLVLVAGFIWFLVKEAIQ